MTKKRSGDIEFFPSAVVSPAALVAKVMQEIEGVAAVIVVEILKDGRYVVRATKIRPENKAMTAALLIRESLDDIGPPSDVDHLR